MTVLEKSINSKKIGVPLLFSIIFLVNAYLRFDIIISEILISDDCINTVKTIFGYKHKSTNSIFGGFWYTSINYILNDLVYIRLFYVFQLSVSAVFTYLVFLNFFKHEVSFLLAIVGFTCPFGMTIINFVNGSHPLNGYVFCIIGIYFGLKLLANNKKYTWQYNVIYVLLASIFCFIGMQFSPLMRIFPLFLIVHFLHARMNKSNVIYFVLVISLTYVANYFTSLTYHYSNKVGWMSYTVENTLRQFFLYGKKFIDFYFINYLSAEFILIAGLAFIVVFLLFRKFEFQKYNPLELSKKIIILSIGFFTTVAGFLVVTSFAMRYLFLSSIFLFSLIALLIYASLMLLSAFDYCMKDRLLFRSGFYIVISLLMSTNVYASSVAQKKYNYDIEFQQNLAVTINNLNTDWKHDAQIVIIDRNFPHGFTNEYNHWSTWYLRYKTNKLNISGLIGSGENLKFYPFRDVYKEHDESYWYIHSSGKSLRKTMIMLTLDRPTYIYRTDSGKLVSIVEYIVIKEDFYYTIYKASKYSLDKINEGLTQEEFDLNFHGRDYMLYDLDPEAEVEMSSIEYNDTSNSFSNNEKKVSLDKLPESYIVSFYIKSLESDFKAGVYSKKLPPMPLLLKPLIIYQEAYNKYKIIVEDNSSEYSYNLEIIPGTWHQIEFKSMHDLNQSELIVDNLVVAEGDYVKLSKTGTIGKGYKNRYWKGEIGRFVISEIDNYETKKIYEFK